MNLRIKEQKIGIREIIAPFISENLDKKRAIELCHVGKFLSIVGNSRIVSHADSPDFIIYNAGEMIGLEHERIFVPEKVKVVKSLEKLFYDSVEVFREKYPKYKILANCWLNAENLLFEKNNSNTIKNQIVEYIHSLVTYEQNVEKPSFIEKVMIMAHSDVSFHYNPGGYTIENLNRKELGRAILKKERLYPKYKEKSGIDKQWLLIVIGSASSDSYEFENHPFLMDIKSNFEKIFLMEDFKAKV